MACGGLLYPDNPLRTFRIPAADAGYGHSRPAVLHGGTGTCMYFQPGGYFSTCQGKEVECNGIINFLKIVQPVYCVGWSIFISYTNIIMNI